MGWFGWKAEGAALPALAPWRQALTREAETPPLLPNIPEAGQGDKQCVNNTSDFVLFPPAQTEGNWLPFIGRYALGAGIHPVK